MSKTAEMVLKATKTICEKPISLGQVNALVKHNHWQWSESARDCMRVSKRFNIEADIFIKYSDPFLLKKYIIDKRNANAYRWNALEIMKYESRYHFKFIEDADKVQCLKIDKETDSIMKELASIVCVIDYKLYKNQYIFPLAFSGYGLHFETPKRK